MVFIQRDIAPASDYFPVQENLIEKTDQDAVLNVVTTANLIGMMQQISLLSKYALDMFKDIRGEADKTRNKIYDFQQKISVLGNSLSTVDEYLNSKKLTELHQNPSIDFDIKTATQENFFSENNRPEHLKELISKAEPPPPLGLLDQFTDGQSCLEKYTNPSFFLTQWIENERENLEKERRLKQEKRQQKREQSQAKLNAKRQIKTFENVTYDKNTGRKIVSGTSSKLALSKPAAAQPPPALAQRQTATLPPTARETVAIAPPPAATLSRTAQPSLVAPPPPAKTVRATESSAKRPPVQIPSAPAVTASPPPPPSPIATAPAVPAPPSIPAAPATPTTPVIPAAPTVPAAPAAPAAPPAPAMDIPAAPPVPIAPAVPAAPIAPVAPVAPVAPKAPNAPTAPTASGNAAAPKPQVNSRASLLDAIRGGIALKKVTAVQQEKPKELDTSVAAILSRRIAIQDSDDESEESDEWSD